MRFGVILLLNCSVENGAQTLSRFPLRASGLERCGGERIFQSSAPDGPGVQGPHGHRAHGRLLPDPGDNAVHGHGLLQQRRCRRLQVQARGPASVRGRLARGTRRFGGLGLLCSGPWSRFSDFLPLPKRRLEEHIRRLGRFMGRSEGGAARRRPAFFPRRFKRRQLEDVRRDRVVRGPELGRRADGCELQAAGSGWSRAVLLSTTCLLVRGACSSARLDPLHRSCSRGSSQHVTVQLPLQVCVWEKRGEVRGSSRSPASCIKYENCLYRMSRYHRVKY